RPTDAVDAVRLPVAGRVVRAVLRPLRAGDAEKTVGRVGPLRTGKPLCRGERPGCLCAVNTTDLAVAAGNTRHAARLHPLSFHPAEPATAGDCARRGNRTAAATSTALGATVVALAWGERRGTVVRCADRLPRNDDRGHARPAPQRLRHPGADSLP